MPLDQPEEIQVSQQYAVRPLAKQDAIFVPVGKWQSLMGRIRNCGTHTAFYEALGWCCIGFGGSALLSAISNLGGMTFYESDPATKLIVSVNLFAIIAEVISWVLGVSSVIVGIISIKFSRQHEQDRADIRSLIVTDMEEHERNHQPAKAAARVLPAHLAMPLDLSTTPIALQVRQ